MEDFLSRKKYSETEIQLLIDSQAEESLHLEFKSNGSLEKTDKKKAEIGKDVSAFANSDGGVIVYGMNEVNHVAHNVTFIDGEIYTKEWLEQVIQTQISPKIPNVEIHPVRYNQEIAKSVYIVKIPSSILSPHMTSDKRYYRRYNFESVPMEDYEVRNLFQRVHKPELEIGDILVESQSSQSMGDSTLHSAGFKIGFQIKNISNQIEHHYKLEIQLPKGIINGNQSEVQGDLLRYEHGYAIYSFFNSSPLFQGELTTLKTIYIDCTPANFAAVKTPVVVKLYYSNGIKTHTYYLEKYLTLKGRSLKEWGWN